LDYLLRDSYYCGTSYGLIDIDYLFKNVSIIDEELIFGNETIKTIENFLLGRYHMNQSIYKHVKNLSIQKVYELFFKEYIEEHYQDKDSKSFLTKLKNNKKLSLTEHQELNDHQFYKMVFESKDSNNKFLKRLANILIQGKVPKLSDEEEEY
jgi:HD superfamily phosphohydrolase